MAACHGPLILSLLLGPLTRFFERLIAGPHGRGAGSQRRAVGRERHKRMQKCPAACGTIERAMAANAERRRPVPLQMPDRLARLLRQTCQGFEALDRELAGDDWFIAGHPMQPDMTTAVGVTFVRHIFPDLIDRARIPRLDARLRRHDH